VTFDAAGRWTAPDGARLTLRHQVALAPARGSLIMLHGWGDHSGLFSEAALRFAEHGLEVFAADQRGAGASPGPRGHIERFAQYLSDVQYLRKHVAAIAPGPQLLLGHSFGAFVVLRYLETVPESLAGAIAITPLVDFRTRPSRWRVALARLLVDVAPRARIATGLDYPHRSRDPAVHEALKSDPLCHEVVTPRAWRETLAALAALQTERDRIAVPLLMVLAGTDYLVSTGAARSFASGLEGDVTTVELDGMYHDLFHEPDRERLYEAVLPWVDRVLGGSR
jgi:lysophospholipase